MRLRPPAEALVLGRSRAKTIRDDAGWVVFARWQRCYLDEIVHAKCVRDATDAIAQAGAGREPVHSPVVHLAEVPGQLAVVLSPVPLRAELDLHRLLVAVGSHQDAVGTSARTLSQASVEIACLLELVSEQLPFGDPARLLVLLQQPRRYFDVGGWGRREAGYWAGTGTGRAGQADRAR
jgi:hypothetical protein